MNQFLIKHPIVTEKATRQNSLGRYVFSVDKDSTKSDIKRLVKKLYNVDVERVSIVNIKSKIKRSARFIGTKPGYKKAIVTLKEGQKIDLT